MSAILFTLTPIRVFYSDASKPINLEDIDGKHNKENNMNEYNIRIPLAQCGDGYHFSKSGGSNTLSSHTRGQTSPW